MSKELNTAISVLKNGGVIVFPTETAYALGCDSRLSHAIEKIMAIKNRDLWKTPPLIAADLEMVERVGVLSDVCRELAQQFWPGALTFVLPVQASTDLSTHVIRDGTIAIRVSSHPIAHALCEALGAPIVATSANIAGEKSCYRMEDVRAQLGTQLPQPDYFLDDGVLPVRPASTMIQEQGEKILVLRQGEIDVCNAQKKHLGKIG